MAEANDDGDDDGDEVVFACSSLRPVPHMIRHRSTGSGGLLTLISQS